MSEAINAIDKFLKRKLKMNSENEQLWHGEQDTVYDHAVYPV